MARETRGVRLKITNSLISRTFYLLCHLLFNTVGKTQRSVFTLSVRTQEVCLVNNSTFRHRSNEISNVQNGYGESLTSRRTLCW